MMLNKFLPKVHKEGYLGYYPVTNADEWEQLPDVYKVMEWFPLTVNKQQFDGSVKPELTFVKNVVFDAVHIEPYKVNAKVSVHRQEVQKILFCNYKEAQCHLYSVCGVEFENGVTASAKWVQDSETGAFAITCGGNYVGKQGGFLGFIPESVIETEEGFKFERKSTKNICHYELMNPFN